VIDPPPTAETNAPPLPPWVAKALVAATVALFLSATILWLAMSTLRQRRLLDAAQAIAVERVGEAERRLGRAARAQKTLDERRAESVGLQALLLGPDDDAAVRATLELMTEAAGLERVDLRLGTVRRGEILGTVAGTLDVLGLREDLPPLLDAIYSQQRVIRLTSLELRDDDDGDLAATLRWDYAAPLDGALDVSAPLDLAPPRLAARSSLLAVDTLNRGRWEDLDAAAGDLRRLAPALRDLAAIDAEMDLLDRRRRAIERWQAASASEARSVQRKLPAAFRMLDVSALGRSVLRPGPGGALQVDEGG